MKSSFLSNKNFIKYLPLILFVFSFLIYALMTCPTIYPRDNAEFVVAIHTLGIPHPPAYPLYVILGKIFTLLIPFGSIAFQANLMSGFFAALAISLLFLIIRKLTGDTTVALITALTLAFSRLFGFYALIADVFTLHIFWLLLIIYLLLKWQEKVIAKQKADNLLYWTAFLYGLGLGNHQTLIFLLLAIIYWVWTTDKKILLPKKIISFAAISLLGLIPLYLLVYLRSKTNPFLDWGNPETLTNLLAVFLRQEFGGVFLSKNFVKGWNFTGIISHFGQYFFSLNNQFHLWGIFGGLGGLIYLFLKKRRDFYFTFLAFLFLGPVMVFLLSNIPLNENIVFVTEKFYLASFAIFALWLGFGIWLILKWLTKIVSRIKLPLSQQIIIAALIIVFPLYNLVFNYSANNKHYYYLNYDYVSNVLKSLDPNAILITPNDSVVFGSWYFQQVENIRPDVIVIQTTPDEINHQQFRQRHPELFSGAQTQNKIFKKIIFPPAENKSSIAKLLEEIILKNIETRPIYFTSGDPALTAPLADFLTPQGLVYQLTTTLNSPSPEKLLAAKNLLENNYQYHDQYKIEDSANFLDKEIFIRYLIAFNDLGIYLMGEGDYDSAYQLLNHALAISPESTIPKNNFSSIIQIQNLLSQLKQNPNDSQLNNQLAKIYFQTRQFNQAAEILAKIIKQEPKNSTAYFNYGLALMKTGQLQPAKINFEKALSIDSSLTPAQSNINFIDYLLAD